MSRWFHVLREAGIGLGRNALMTVAVVLSVAVSLTLFGAALLLNRQVDLVAEVWQDNIEVSIFLCDDARCPAITPEQQDQLRADLEAEPVVEEVFFQSKQEAFEVFTESFADQPALVDNVSPDTLPASFRVKLSDPERFAVIEERFSATPGVEEVVDQGEILDSFLRLADILRTGALWVAGIQLAAGAVLIANTIRVAAFARREQTAVMKLVGASNWYIRLPFVLEGMIEGLMGAGIATALLWFAFPFAREAIASQISFVPIILRDAVVQVSLVLGAVGLGISALSSVLSLQRSLDV